MTEVLPSAEQKPAVRTVRGREHPTYSGFAQTHFDAVDFPIDVVYTWVDGADPELRARREKYRTGASRIHARETGASRYVSHDELKYSLRSLETYAPFVRNVYIVTDDQTPAWLDRDAAGVQVVTHEEIFTDRDALSVFNSHAIETQLHHIPGLSERYLYFNDDVFLGRAGRCRRTSSTATAWPSSPSPRSSSASASRILTSPRPTQRARTCATC